MGAADETDYAGRLVDLSMQLEEAFPDYRCLRCGSEKFVLRLIVDAAQAGEDPPVETLETTCKRCGMVELHRARVLTDALLADELPRRSNA